MRPEPWICRKTRRPARPRTRSPCHASGALPRSMSARDQYGTTRLPLDAAAHALVLQLGIKRREIDGEEIVRNGVKRRSEFLGRRARSGEQRLVITGDESRVAAVGGNARGTGVNWLSMNSAHRARISAVDGCRGRAWRRAISRMRSALRQARDNRRRAPAMRRPERSSGPAGKRVEGRRHELRRVRGLGRGGAGGASLARRQQRRDDEDGASATQRRARTMEWIYLESIVALAAARGHRRGGRQARAASPPRASNGSKLSRTDRDAEVASSQCSVRGTDSVNRRNRRVERLAVLGDHLIGAAHRADRRRECSRRSCIRSFRRA
mgnify:CR=1 FL=1